MKKLTCLVAICLSINVIGQEVKLMKVKCGILFHGNIPITSAQAAVKSIDVSMEAFNHFSAATTNRIINYALGYYGWNSFLEGREHGLTHASHEYITPVALGTICISVIPGREAARRRRIYEGALVYNKAIMDINKSLTQKEEIQ